jgi:alkanesulfonate monooxygenase SsuD/methylene tetrahydromethanopterin reductase-like flavin-dependent oxidoreductase (luciferase family)
MRMPKLADAKTVQLSPLDLERAQSMLRNIIVGDAATVAERVREFAEEAQADEVMITTFLPNQADRVRSVTSLAGAWGIARTEG